jgi:hypothetical protein
MKCKLTKVSHMEFQRLWKFCKIMEKFLCPRVVWLQSKLTTPFGVQVSNTVFQYICETSSKTWRGHLCVKLDIHMDR